MNPIFCPSNHLMHDQAACPVCGWQPPPPIPQGSLLWEPVTFACGIGGPPKESFVRAGVTGGIAVFPLRSGELAAIEQKNGHLLWRTEPSPDLYPRQLYAQDGGTMLCTVADNRPIDRAGNGCLARLDPKTGALEKVWSGYGYTMTEPIFTAGHIIVRTARPKLVALDRSMPGSVLWEAPLRTYKPVSPAASAEFVFAWDGEVTKEQMLLKAFTLETGNLAWQTNVGEIDTTPIVVGDQLIYRMNKQMLTSVKTADGKQLWQKKFDKIYSAPLSAAGRIFMVVCGSEDAKSTERYSLLCLNPANGESEWQLPLGIRAQEIVSLPDGNLLLGMGTPKLAICSPRDGSVQWQYSFGTDTVNRVQSHLVVNDGILWLGTYDGLAAAIRIAEPAKSHESPQKYLKEGNFEAAALAFAREKNWEKSAELFLDKLDQPRKALAIYEHTGDILGQAQALGALGDELGAAKLLQKAGKLTEAAVLFEKVGEVRTSMHIHQELGNVIEFSRLRNLVPLEFSDIEQLEKERKYVEAGNAAIRLSEYRKAVDLFAQAGEKENGKLLDALVRLCDVNPEPWSLTRLAELSRKMELYRVQAQALEKQGETESAAEAYLLAAHQVEERDPADMETIASLFEKAHQYFELEGIIDKQRTCWGKILKYRRKPWILVTGQSEEGKTFRECEFNKLTLEVRNIGFGRADEIDVQVESDRFEVEPSSRPGKIPHLAAGRDQTITLPIRPLESQVGEGVPFTLTWSWQDRNAHRDCDKTIVYVNVKKKDDARTGGTPVIIKAEHYYAGNDYHKEIAGDVIETGGQKGDKVEVNRDGKVKVFDSEYGELTPSNLLGTCPHCGKSVFKDDKYCIHCSAKIK